MCTFLPFLNKKFNFSSMKKTKQSLATSQHSGQSQQQCKKPAVNISPNLFSIKKTVFKKVTKHPQIQTTSLEKSSCSVSDA
jgi:hypothetical protein